jgi:hypothetical protein
MHATLPSYLIILGLVTPTEIRGGLVSLWLYKKKRSYGIKKMYEYLYIPHRARCSNFFNPSKKNCFGRVANREIGNAKDLSAPLRMVAHFPQVSM